MKIYAFEVREDERDAFEKYEEELNLEITCTSRPLSMSNIHKVKGYDGVTILGMSNIGKDELNALKENGVTLLTTRTIGINHIDTDYAKSIGIRVANAGYPPNGVAEYTVMMILLCLRHYKAALWRTNVNDFSLSGLIGKELNDLTVGVIGTGRIGYTVIKCLSGFGCRILAYDPYESEGVKRYADYVSLEELYAQSDIITLHMPLLDSNLHMINQQAIEQMKDGVVLINCARGPLMDVDALINNIENRKIGALGLDVMEDEEGIVHEDRRTDIISNRKMAYLRQFPNVVHTQHMAFYTDTAVSSMVYYGLNGLCEMSKNTSYRNEI